nr:MAG TPA: hypothetical protein [Caudoviricetes sp.]
MPGTRVGANCIHPPDVPTGDGRQTFHGSRRGLGQKPIRSPKPAEDWAKN